MKKNLNTKVKDNHGNIFDAWLEDSEHHVAILFLQESTGSTYGKWSWYVDTLMGRGEYSNGKIGDRIDLDSGQGWYVTGMSKLMDEVERATKVKTVIASARINAIARVVLGWLHVDVKNLSVGVQRALKSIPYHSKDVPYDETEKYSPSQGSSHTDGNRGLLMIVDINTGKVEDSQQGSWGGSNMFENNKVDVDRASYPIPAGKVVIVGETGYTTFIHMLVNPSDKAILMPSHVEAPKMELTENEQNALKIIAGIKGGYRSEYFRKKGLGVYGADNPIIQSLKDKGLVKVMANGIAVTTSGRNVRETFENRYI